MRRVPQAEPLDRLRSDIPLIEVAGGSAGRGAQLRAEVRVCELVNVTQSLPFRVLGPVALRVVRFGDGQSEALGQGLHGLWKAELLVELDELQDVAAGRAAEAVEEALLAVDVEARGLLAMERAQALERASHLPEGHHVLDHLDDVGLRLEIGDEPRRETCHAAC